MSFRFLPQARAELFEGISYYASIRPELGMKFEQAVSEAIGKALAHPEHGAQRSKSTRRVLVKSFPFGVIYRSDLAGVLVVAVAHERKKPDYWVGRVR